MLLVHKFSLFLYFIIITSEICETANILGIVPSATYSHQWAYRKFWTALSLKGHNVTVLTANPQHNRNLINLTEIDLSIGYEFIEKNYNWPAIIVEQTNPLKFLRTMMEMMVEVTPLYLSLKDVQLLIDNSRFLHFDVVITEAIYPEWLIMGEIFQCPTIALKSLDPTDSLHKVFQNPTHPIIYPDIFTTFAGRLSFKERLISTVLSWLTELTRRYYTGRRQTILDRHFGNLSRPIDDLIKKSSLLFIFVNRVLLLPRPYSPRTIVIGGTTIDEQGGKLPEDVEEFLDSAKEGAILFSLGSNVRSDLLGDEVVNSIIKQLEILPYKTLWKFNNTNNKYNIPSNVKIYNFLPQQYILRHPNVKLFINHGGIQSLEEAIHFSIPLVGIPFFADQMSNIKRLEMKGVLKRIAIRPHFNGTEFHQAVLEVIRNKTYKENMIKLNDLSIDLPPMDRNGVEKAIWWTEYVIRRKGNVEHLINDAEVHIPFYQYYFVDIFLFFFSVILFINLIIYWLWYLIRFFIRAHRHRSSNKKNM